MATTTLSSGLAAATATATATATAAASSSKHRPARLPTPKSATYPSSLHSPLLPTPTYLNREESLKTPITPPSAYLDFLSKLSPAIKSPLSTGNSTAFSFLAPKSPAVTAYPPAPASARPIMVSNPSSTSSVDSRDSISSTSSAHTTQSAPTANSSKPLAKLDPAPSSFPTRSSQTSLTQAPPPSPARRTGPIRRPSLMIPPSPSTHSPALMSPASASTHLNTPASAGAAAKAFYTSRSPVESWAQVLSAGPRGTQTRPVSVRHVITRTVTYTQRCSGSGSEPASAGPGESSPVVGSVRGHPGSHEPSPKPESPNDLTPPPHSLAHKSGQTPLVGDAPRGKRRKVE